MSFTLLDFVEASARLARPQRVEKAEILVARVLLIVFDILICQRTFLGRGLLQEVGFSVELFLLFG